MHTENTLTLDAGWDICFDVNGNLRFATGAEAVCQNVANECRLFLHDAYFRWEDGIAWFTDQLGKPLQASVLTDRLRRAALRVPGVLAVKSIELTDVDQATRTLHASMEIETSYGNGRASI